MSTDNSVEQGSREAGSLAALIKRHRCADGSLHMAGALVDEILIYVTLLERESRITKQFLKAVLEQPKR